MRNVLDTLHRVREHEKRNATMIYAAAEHERVAQEEHVESIEEEIRRSHTGQTISAGDLAHEHDYRGHMELTRQEEQGRLVTLEETADVRQQELTNAAIDAGVTEKVLESRQAERDLHRRRSTQKTTDGRNAARWYRNNRG